MGSSFVPGQPLGQGLEIPAVDFKAVGSQIAAGLKESGTWADKTATEIAGFGDLIGRALEYLCGRIGAAGAEAAHGGGPTLKAVATCIDSGLSIMLGLQTAMQGEGTTGFFQFLASLLSDLLGVEVSPAVMQAAFRSGGRVAGMEAAGKGLSDLLIKELTAGQADTLTASTAGIETFLGFVLAFTVREANIEFLSTLAEHIPVIGQYLKFDDTREYAVRMAENLGLGRLTRLALRPLFNILAVQPATWALNEKYRPARFKEGDLQKYRRMGLLDSAAAQAQLKQIGYRDEDIAVLFKENFHPANPAELMERLGNKDITREQFTGALAAQGYTDQESADALQVQVFARTQRHWRTYLDHVLSQAERGLIPIESAYGFVDQAPLVAEEAELLKNVIALVTAVPRTLLTVAQLDTAWSDGFIDLFTWERLIGQHGYDAESVAVLREEMLLKKSTGGTKAIIKELPLAEAKKALKTGLWTVSQFADYLNKLGFDAEARAALVALYGPTAGSTAPAPGAITPPAP